MIWLIPRFDPGALTAHHRPHAGGVSTARGQRLPYGAFPRLVMLWMYAEGARDAHDPPQDRDPVLSICQYLLTIDLESPEVTPLFEQADRLFACRFRVGQRTIPVIDPSFVRNADAALRLAEVASTRGTQLAYSAPFHQETMRRRFAPRLATVRALRHCPFALDVYLWDAGLRAARTVGDSPFALAPGRIPRARRPPRALPRHQRGPRLRARARHRPRDAPAPRGGAGPCVRGRPFGLNRPGASWAVSLTRILKPSTPATAPECATARAHRRSRRRPARICQAKTRVFC